MPAYNTWGSSWRTRWGNSWGASSPAVAVTVSPPGAGALYDQSRGTKYDGLDRIEEIKVRYDAILGIASKASEETKEISKILAPYAPVTFGRLPPAEDIDFTALEENLLHLARLESLIAAIEAMNAADDALLFALAAVA